MLHMAVIGSGPAGYYTAEAAAKQWGDVRIDIFDRLPVPYGLIRTGVAPDHQSIKGVARRFEKTNLSDEVRFVGNVHIGQDISIEELQRLYHAVVLATGAPHDRTLDIPGSDLTNVFGSAAMVGWYNGHPDFAALSPDLSGRHAVIVGMGNVALDIARILAKTEAEFAGSDIVGHALDTLRTSRIDSITILGRRGPHQIAMTPKELGELLQLERAAPRVDAADLPPVAQDAELEPGVRKSVDLLREFAALDGDARAAKPVEIAFDMFASPVAFHGHEGRVAAVEIEETRLVNDRPVATGRKYRLPADVVVTCIGYRSAAIPGVAFDERAGRFDSEEGRIGPGLYCVGWARRGPSGTIGTNRPDGYAVVERIAEDRDRGTLGDGDRAGRAGFDALARERKIEIVTFRDWKRIEEAEAQAAREGAPREKFVDIEAMIEAACETAHLPKG